MAAKLDYLRDLRNHPHSTGGEAAARLDIPEATVLEAYRRSRRQGFVEGDGGRPEKFVLSDAGLAQLRVLEESSKPSPGPAPKIEEKFDELEQTVRDVVEDVKGLFGIVDRVLGTKVQRSAPTDDLADELHAQTVELQDEIVELEAEKERCEQEVVKKAKVLEYYATQIALARFSGRSEMLQARAEEFAQGLDSETQQAVRRLVRVEAEVGEERHRWFGPDKDRVSKLETQIAELREKLGFAVGASEESEEKEDEEAD